MPERTPDALFADEGYDAIRVNLTGLNVEAVIPGRSNRSVKLWHDWSLYKQRNRVERTFGHLKISRAISTRYNQLVNGFLSMAPIDTAR